MRPRHTTIYTLYANTADPLPGAWSSSAAEDWQYRVYRTRRAAEGMIRHLTKRGLSGDLWRGVMVERADGSASGCMSERVWNWGKR